MTLSDVQELALQLGYGKAGVASNKPLGARVNMGPFFDQYGVKAFSNFKKKFFSEPLRPIAPGGTPMVSSSKNDDDAKVETVRVEVKPEDIPSVDKYDELVASYPSLKWRVISRPGGATMKPTDFYRLNACVKQVVEGDNTSEKPMWAAHGGLDFDGRENWDQWTKLKGLSTLQAKEEFCKVYAEAQAVPKENFRMY
eukprot:CAMPEP_0114250264 /NCGR_PEP_ID=MMETSP0058-20121206/14602_1 /TAXON_ID=36894 /ORGANISM="Pyramimonas parkeae, CCMP726" /LENGTH=196 /DNA_ID=CAMNT_0001363903 /DNA_START=218 /DNA_END=808 /DNA_ORIENTATION=-